MMEAARYLRRGTTGKDRADSNPDRIRSCARDGQGQGRYHAIALGCDQRRSRGMHIPPRAGSGSQRHRRNHTGHTPSLGRAQRPRPDHGHTHPARGEPTSPRCAGLQLPALRHPLVELLGATVFALPTEDGD